MNKNKNSDYNIIFENPNLLNYFTIGSIFDTSQVQLFENEEISLVNNLNIQETLDVNFFDISGKKFSKKMPDYKQSLITLFIIFVTFGDGSFLFLEWILC